MTRLLVLGGTRSGKSRLAEKLAREAEETVLVVATAQPDSLDAEMAERVAAHRARRPTHWRTFETDDLHAALREAGDHTTVVVDALDTWLARRMEGAGLWTDQPVAPLDPEERRRAAAILDDLRHFWEEARGRPGVVVVVAGQPGWGPTPASASTRRYLDLHGDALRLLAEQADRVLLTVAGRAIDLGEAPGPAEGRYSDVRPHVPTTCARPDVPEAEDHRALREHGDTQAPPGTLNLAVNVLDGPPPWLRRRLADHVQRLAPYPDVAAARAAAADRHGRPSDECLLLNGAAEGFWLLATALCPRLAVCVHPSFTEPEAALRAHGRPVLRVHRQPGTWSLDPRDVPEAADVVVLGRPDNPTGVVDPVDTLLALTRPGRTLVIDEAFAEFQTDAHGLAGRRDLPGLVVVRSLTKIWGLAGLRVGYLLADADLVARLAALRQPWPVGSLAAEALQACLDAEDERIRRVRIVEEERAVLITMLRTLPGVRVWPSAANFVLLAVPGMHDLRDRLLERGIAVRCGETFPGLGADHVRVAVRDRDTTGSLVGALAAILDVRRTSADKVGVR